MIKVLKKASDILDLVDGAAGRPVLTGELSSRLDLTQPTCSRIVGDLVKLGLLDSAEGQKGVVIGQKLRKMGVEPAIFRDLERIGGDLAQKCAENLRESVLLCGEHNFSYYVLVHHRGNPEFSIEIGRGPVTNLYRYASGRAFLAWKGEEYAKKYVEQAGFPGELWRNITKIDDLSTALEEIRNEGYEASSQSDLIIMTSPIYKASRVVATIGCYAVRGANISKERIQIMRDAVSETAELITKAL